MNHGALLLHSPRGNFTRSINVSNFLQALTLFYFTCADTNAHDGW